MAGWRAQGRRIGLIAALWAPAALGSPSHFQFDSNLPYSDEIAGAEALAEARGLFRAGRFRGVLGLETEPQAPGDAAAFEALKARAALAEAFRVGLWPRGADWVRMAAGHAERAAALDPSSHEGPLLLATALGLTARAMGDLPAFASGIAERARDLLAQAARLAPESGSGAGQVLAAQAAWHLDVSRRAGADLARSLFGADRAEGLRLLRAAAGKAPEDLAVRFEIALALLTLDARVHGAEARAALDAVRRGRPRDGFEALLREEAGALLDLLTLEDGGALQARLAALQGYRGGSGSEGADEGAPG